MRRGQPCAPLPFVGVVLPREEIEIFEQSLTQGRSRVFRLLGFEFVGAQKTEAIDLVAEHANTTFDINARPERNTHGQRGQRRRGQTPEGRQRGDGGGRGANSSTLADDDATTNESENPTVRNRSRRIRESSARASEVSRSRCVRFVFSAVENNHSVAADHEHAA